VLDVWFPRSLDRAAGGFLCDFGRDWTARGPQHKRLEFQARQTLLAAEALPWCRGERAVRMRRALEHGFDYLRDVLWDGEHGGWYHCLDRNRTPRDDATKHVHGFAYAIQACVAVYEATGDARALALAQTAFVWIERHAYDRRHGGWSGFMRRDGQVIREPGSWPRDLDTIGTPLGMKDINVHSDLLECLTALHRVWPDATVAARLAELVRLSCTTLLAPLGGTSFMAADLTPVRAGVRFGHQVQTAYRLLAARAFADDPAHVVAVARRALDYALAYGWDRARGGLRAFGARPTIVASDAWFLSSVKPWWIQFELLLSLLTMARLLPDGSTYTRLARRQWRYLEAHVFDGARGGVFAQGLDVVPRWRRFGGGRLAHPAVTTKGHEWKDGSHEGRVILACLRPSRPLGSQSLGSQ